MSKTSNVTADLVFLSPTPAPAPVVPAPAPRTADASTQTDSRTANASTQTDSRVLVSAPAEAPEKMEASSSTADRAMGGYTNRFSDTPELINDKKGDTPQYNISPKDYSIAIQTKGPLR